MNYTNINQNTLNAAKKGDMTPLCINNNNKSAIFAGSQGEKYNTTTENCTCMSFIFNRGESPCKHMIRLAIELGIITCNDFVTDKKQALSKYYMGVLQQYIKTKNIIDSVQLIKTINELLSKPSIELAYDNCLAFIGIKSLLEIGFFEKLKTKNKMKVNKQIKKHLSGLQVLLEKKIGEKIFSNIDNKDVKEILYKINK